MLRHILKLGSPGIYSQSTVIIRQGSTAVMRDDFRAFGKMLRKDPVVLTVLFLGFTGLFGMCNYSVSVCMRMLSVKNTVEIQPVYFDLAIDIVNMKVTCSVYSDLPYESYSAKRIYWVTQFGKIITVQCE